MFIEDENLVLEDEEFIEEDTENVEEQTTEETVDAGTEEVTEEKVYTEDELNKRLDELLAKKIARKESKLRKELEKEYQPYKELGTVVNAGLGVNDVNEATTNLRKFYTEKGVVIPNSQPSYNGNDLKVLANSEANDIIEAGFDDVVEEVDRLAQLGVENMTPREKLVFSKLAEYRQAESAKKELSKIGVSSDVISSKEFKAFAEQFNTNTPITKVYEFYTKMNSETVAPTEKIGSMKNGNAKEDKNYYSPDDVDKLTEKELDDPKIFELVRKSMLKWKG